MRQGITAPQQEGGSDVCCNMDGPWRYTKGKEPRAGRQTLRDSTSGQQLGSHMYRAGKNSGWERAGEGRVGDYGFMEIQRQCGKMDELGRQIVIGTGPQWCHHSHLTIHLQMVMLCVCVHMRHTIRHPTTTLWRCSNRLQASRRHEACSIPQSCLDLIRQTESMLQRHTAIHSTVTKATRKQISIEEAIICRWHYPVGGH